MRGVSHILAWLIPVAVLGACGGSSGPPKCIPGASVECACPVGQRGAQTCNGAGTFEACVCASTQSDGGGLGGMGGATGTGGAGGMGTGGGAGGTSGGSCTGVPTA